MNSSPDLPLSGELAEALEIAQAIAQAERAPAVRFEHFLLAALFCTFPPHAHRLLLVAAAVRDRWQQEVDP